MVANNTIREDENVEYVDGKVGYRTRIIKKGVDSSDYEDILEAQIWWIPDYKHSELLEWFCVCDYPDNAYDFRFSCGYFPHISLYYEENYKWKEIFLDL